jgi:hypothetical protein
MFFQAQAKVHARKVPAYLHEALPYEVLVRLTKESGLPREAAAELQTLAVALDIALAPPKRKRPGAKQVKREVDRFFQQVKKLTLTAKSLSPDAWVVITGPPVRVDDGSTEIETWEQSQQDKFDDAIAALHDLLKLKRTNKVEPGRGGRHLPPAALAEIYLDNLLVQHGCDISLQARTELSDSLFEDVKSQPRRRRRAKNAARSDTPRIRDFVRRTSKRRIARH